MLVQDQKGRTKPLYTLSSDILRKVSRENKFGDNSPMQVFLGLYFDFDNWKDVPLIRISNKDLQKSLGIRGNMAAFSDLVKMEWWRILQTLGGDQCRICKITRRKKQI